MKGALAVFFLLFFAFALAGCTPANRRPGYIYYSIAADPSTLDPAFITDVTGGSIAAKLFNGLVRIGPGFKIIPDIAGSWEVSRDRLVYTFFLRRDVRFSNGREVTAADFKYSFERLLSPKTLSPNRWVLEALSGARAFAGGRAGDVSGIKVDGRYELTLRLAHPFSPFLNLLAMTAACVVPREDAGRPGSDFYERPVGTGPFAVESWIRGQTLTLEARPDYFGGAARVKGIVYRVIPEELTSVVEFELGNLDVISIPAADYDHFRDDPKWRRLISTADGINTYYLGLNCSKPPFNDARMRRAMNYAIDRKKILETFMEGRGTLASGPVPPGLRRWSAPPSYEYDPARARRIIREEGFSGATVSFYVTQGQDDADIAGIIQQYLSRVGIRARLKQLEWNTYKEAIDNGEPDLFWLSWWADYADPENFLYPLFDSANLGAAGNRTLYKNREADRLIELGRSAATAARRDYYYKKAEDMIVHDAPWVFFWHEKNITVRQPWVKNYVQYPIYSMDKGTDIGIGR
ncbi:MAG: ABC transporter substrate-binding protein [Nitrospiraceae bacterium]|nr:ABC transporter substrate-binding protein [Nitrospiraceae bacterium]